MRFAINRYFGLLFFLIYSIPASESIEFSSKVRISEENENAEFSINPHSCLAIDYAGTAHFFYMIPQVKDNKQSQIVYRSILSGMVSAAQRVDNGTKGGARNPSAVIGLDNSIHVVWNDSRNCTAAGKWIDNVEIYYNTMKAGGVFPREDIRISKTQASHNGDNGFAPHIAVTPEGRLSVIWYDFHRNGTNADIYLRESDQNGLFQMVDGIDEWKITSSEEQPNLSYWMPALALLPNSMYYLLWGLKSGYSGFFELQGMAKNNVNHEIVEIDPQGGRFNDPPRLIADKVGNLGLIYCVYENSIYRIKFRYKPYSGAWGKAIYVDEGISNAQLCDPVFDSTGNIHLTWQDDRDGFDGIYYALLNPQKTAIEDRVKISSDDIEAKTPCIAIDPRTSQIHLAWLEKEENGLYSVFYVYERMTGVGNWRAYSDEWIVDSG